MVGSGATGTSAQTMFAPRCGSAQPMFAPRCGKGPRGRDSEGEGTHHGRAPKPPRWYRFDGSHIIQPNAPAAAAPFRWASMSVFL
jgi:hypothetical protein